MYDLHCWEYGVLHLQGCHRTFGSIQRTLSCVVVSSKCDSLLVVAFRQPLKDEIEGVEKILS